MEFHQIAFVQAVALACTVSFGMAGCDSGQEEARASAPFTMLKTATTTVGTEIDDSVVTGRVRSALLSDPDVKSFDIKVETRKGQVQLSGFVGSQARVDHAIALTRNVEGVKGVENGMSVMQGKASVGNTFDDGVITAKVKSALLSDPGVKSFDIAIVTRKGQVQLSGYVDNQTQINRAIEVARGVEGVQSIGNEMSVKK
jgi:hyperosmotically inducible protein